MMSLGIFFPRQSERPSRRPLTLLCGLSCSLLAAQGCANDLEQQREVFVESAPRAVLPPVTWDGSARPVTSMLSIMGSMKQSETQLIATQRLTMGSQIPQVGAGLVEPNQGELIHV